MKSQRFVLALILVAASTCSAQEPAKDYTKVDPQSLGIEPLAPKKDAKTGFLVGGKNPTALIRKLTHLAGRPIADLEKDMRPGGFSTKGFLGKDERLLDILAMDNDYVLGELGMTHQELAKHLHVIGAVAFKHATLQPVDLAYHGKKLRVRATLFRGFAQSPFEDGTKTNCETTVENMGNGKKLSFSLLVPHMVERYGFYEGKGTPYRVEPRDILAVFDFLKAAKGNAPKAEAAQMPGVVITHSPASSKVYIGSPSLAVLDNGDYLATHDQFGKGSTEWTSAVTRVFRSADRGQTWSHVTDIQGAFWSTLFVHRGDVYLMGTTKHHGNAVIRRSSDGGKTWTSPTDSASGLLRVGAYHCAPVPVVIHAGRLWRALEDAGGGTQWGKRYRAMMLSAPLEADLLRANSWTASNFLERDPLWLDGRFNAWLEGNAVVTPDGRLVNILRVDTPDGTGTAAIVRLSDDAKLATFDSAKDFLDFPGGATKFTIRQDPRTRDYWALSNYIPPQHVGGRPATRRNTLALIKSTDLKAWTVRAIVLYHPDPERHGFQYVDWHFDADDIIAVSRTAFDDELGGARNFHDANFLTFHRIRDFCNLTGKGLEAARP